MDSEEFKKMLEEQAERRKLMNKMVSNLADIMALSGEPTAVFLSKYQHLGARLNLLADSITGLKNEIMCKEATSLLEQFNELVEDFLTEYDVKLD